MNPVYGLASLGLGLALAVPAPKSETIAVQAGTIHLVEGGQRLSGGATILIRDGRIVAVGKDLALPADARVVDYGADAVIIPGLVSADSPFWLAPAPRTADAGLRAVDHIDPYADYWAALVEGITTVYIAPARGRLIAGQGAVVKAAGEKRMLEPVAAIHGSIAAEARNTPGYWEPPIPATVDQGMGVAEPQLPHTTMGAVVALQEVLALAQFGASTPEYGPYLAADLAPLMEAKKPWRMGAESQAEIQALIDFFGKQGLPLVLDGPDEAGLSLEPIARSGFPVIVDVSLVGNNSGRDFGKGQDARWPNYETASRLAQAGVRIAIVPGPGSPGVDLRLAAAVAMRGGLSEASALQAITLDAARILGVDKRVGSIVPGKDADLTVLNGEALDPQASVLATWIDGEVAWKQNENSAVVLSVEELHLGDGHVLAPGEVAMRDGKIIEVGTRVTRPRGATVVRGKAAMPGMIDACGYLGLEGSREDFSPRMQLGRIVEPGDATDRRVAKAGVTTVVLASRGSIGSGSPTLAYKPAGDDPAQMVIADPNALRLQWTERIRSTSGEKVKETLVKADEYKKKWEEYEKAIADWKPAPPKAEKSDEKKDESAKEGEEGAAEKSDSKEDDKAKSEESKPDEKKEEGDSKKKKEEQKLVLTGVWETGEPLTTPAGSAILRLRLLENGGAVEGALRCAAFTDGLIDLSGKLAEKNLELCAKGTRGEIKLTLEWKDGKLAGKLAHAGAEHELKLAQTFSEYGIAKRAELRREKEPEEPKDKPKSPGVNPELEPLRLAMLGRAAVLVSVEREDEILACVDAFAAYGIKPVLHGASRAYLVADKIRGRVAGVIPGPQAVESGGELGTRERNLHAELQAAGIPVAFQSLAEEGAADLPLLAAWSVAHGLSADGALRALTTDAAQMLGIGQRVGRLAAGLDADVLLMDASPLSPAASVRRVWVNGKELR